MMEKLTEEIRVKIQKSLLEQFKNKCELNFKTVSIVVRELMLNYIKKDDKYG